MSKPRGPDKTNAERQRRYRAKRSAALRVIRNGSNAVTSQAVEKPEDVTRNAIPTTTLSPREESYLLFPESLTLSPRVRAGVCVRARVAIPMPETLTDDEVEVFWAEVRRYRPDIDAESYVVNFHAHYAGTPDREGNLKQSFWWLVTLRAWLMRDLERQQSKFEVGTVAHTIREKRQVEAALGAIANGQVRPGNGSGMRQSNLQDVPGPNRDRPESMGGGTGNVVHGAFGGGGQERDKYGYPKAQKVADSGAPRRIADGRGRAD